MAAIQYFLPSNLVDALDCRGTFGGTIIAVSLAAILFTIN